MIYSVNGKVIHIEQNLAVIETAGVGYACRATSSTISGLKVGETVKLLTYLYIREDLMELFGFSAASELSAFKLLISVSGVGPKAALSVLSDLSPQGFALCVASGDSKLLTRSQGIGAKIAQRIVLELKDKIDRQFNSVDFSETTMGSGDFQPLLGKRAESVSALMVLGFSSHDAMKALSGLDENLSASELIKAALKRLS
ncbi:MAG: Holliday junction branch migration protein RuvA [Eubacterium sp.]|jgi:Holliday junction DNA helicase RuvA|nr:Holliday junction branch migration protein RuvA [Eubacterium sp.]